MGASFGAALDQWITGNDDGEDNMSTGHDCRIYRCESGRTVEWVYRIDRAGDEFETFGPFATLEEAERHLLAHRPNPGAWEIVGDASGDGWDDDDGG
jgi:hypothetical protein